MISALFEHAWRIFTFRHDGSGLDCSRQTLYALLVLESVLFLIMRLTGDTAGVASQLVFHIFVFLIIITVNSARVSAGILISGMMMSVGTIVPRLVGFPIDEVVVVSVCLPSFIWFALRMIRTLEG